MVHTHRKINVTAHCDAYFIAKGGNGWSEDIEALHDGDGTATNISVPIKRGVRTTQYWTENALNETGCGDGYMEIFAFESSATKPWFYSCNVRVSKIAQTATEDQQISDKARRIFAQSIALQGFTFFATKAEENKHDGGTVGAQFQTYPAGSYWGYPENGDAVGVANVAEFAILAIATTALSNNLVETMGDQPQRGEALSVEWKNIYIILGLIADVQLFFMIVTSFIANLVFIKDDNHLSVAIFLRPMVDRVVTSGNAADGR